MLLTRTALAGAAALGLALLVPLHTATAASKSSRIVFDFYANYHRQIYSVRPNGSNERALTPVSWDDVRYPTLSPDGSKIAFESNRDGDPDIYVMNANGSHRRKTTHNGVPDGSPAWAPNGKRIAFLSDTPNTRAGIFIMRADGSHRHPVPGTAGASDPSFAPGGKRIAFVRTYPNTGDIATIRTDGTDRRRLTFSSRSDTTTSPSYSPTSGDIAFVSDRNGPFEVFTMNADGSDQRSLRPCGGWASPSYSPNGKRIAFAKPSDVFTMSTSGDKLRQVTHVPNPPPARYRAFAEYPDWGG